MPTKSILRLLQGGDRRTIGRAGKVAAIVAKDSALFPELMSGLWSDNLLVRSGAADATEKVTRDSPQLLSPYKEELLGLMADATEQELRWHLAVMIPRLALTSVERKSALSVLNGYLEGRSSIVKTCALQGLADLAQDDPSIRPGVLEMLREATRSGTPAMKARSRKLLLQMKPD